MPTELDPFTKVFNGLWSLVDASEPLKRLIQPGNFIRYNKAQDRDPFKTNVQVGDLPELILIATGSANENIHQSSCNSAITRRYSFLLSTGDLRITQFLLPFQFGLYCALVNYDSILRPLTWAGQLFVMDANWEGMTEGLSNPDANRGIKGWSALWNCRVRMSFSTSKLKEYNNT